MFTLEKIVRGQLRLVEEPLFHRYLFIQLDTHPTGKGWHNIRSTRGVSGLVSFGNRPAKVANGFVEDLQQAIAQQHTAPIALFAADEAIRIQSGAFKGMEGIFKEKNGEQRAFILLEILGKLVKLNLPMADLAKTS